MHQTLTPDLCVIGAGSAGLSVAAGAAQLGASVVLIERGAMGGDCLNVGCVPVQEPDRRRSGRTRGGAPAAPFGMAAPATAASTSRPCAGTSAASSRASRRTTASSGSRGWASPCCASRPGSPAPDIVEAGEQPIRARRFVVATGSRPAMPPMPGLAGYRAT